MSMSEVAAISWSVGARTLAPRILRRQDAVNSPMTAPSVLLCAVYPSWSGQLHKDRSVGNTIVQVTRPGAVNCTKTATRLTHWGVCRFLAPAAPRDQPSLAPAAPRDQPSLAPAAPRDQPSLATVAPRDQPSLAPAAPRDQPPLAPVRKTASRSSPTAPDVAGRSMRFDA
jgi:hypothetical protein